MKKNPSEIEDNEIRIISACEPETRGRKRRSLRTYLYVIAGIIVLIVLGIALNHNKEDKETTDGFTVVDAPIASEEAVPDVPAAEPAASKKGFTTARDTVVDNRGLLILSAEHARPRLIVGTELLDDSNIVLAAQAADIRSDNGQIAGTFVLDGELLSKGEAKAGYCAIVNGELTIGVADATPMLEQALTDKGYFFRQYPLVVGGQVVENKPKGKAIRKALAEIGGKICVVISRERQTFHDFSQLLVDAGARNAIYLVGSASYGYYVTDTGERIEPGTAPWQDIENVSYIVWEKT